MALVCISRAVRVEALVTLGGTIERPRVKHAPRQMDFDRMVGVRGFEPPTPASRTQYSTRLSYTPNI